MLYYVSLIVLIGFYLSSKGNDILNIPPNLYISIFMRILGGFFSDILLYIAFNYMSYSRGICIFFTNTLMIPIFARCILKEPILKIDAFGIAMGFAGMLLIVQPFK
jgi:drug/metabolite transporter (DMT)-like permease